jgi:hypothetical protein
MVKVPQTPADLKTHLEDSIYFLEASAAAFDAGYENEAKRMAITLRVLLHDTKSSKSLLSQLGQKSIQFYDTAKPFDPRNLVGHGGLVAIRYGPEGARVVPVLDEPWHGQARKVDFDAWWNTPIFADLKRRIVTRKQLVLAVANEDGGGHVDPKLDEAYGNLSRHYSLGWYSVKTDTRPEPIAGAERAAIRQIAHEMLKTLKPGYTKLLPKS